MNGQVRMTDKIFEFKENKIMAKKTRAERNLTFETLQLHVGQETRLRMQERYQSTRHHHSYSTTHSMQLTDSHSRMPATSTEDLQIQQRMYLREESRPSRVALQHWQLAQAQQQLHIPCTCRRPPRSSKEYLRRNIQSPCTYTQGLQCRYNIR